MNMKYASEFIQTLKQELWMVTTWTIPLYIDGKECDSIELKGNNDTHDFRIEIKTKDE